MGRPDAVRTVLLLTELSILSQVSTCAAPGFLGLRRATATPEPTANPSPTPDLEKILDQQVDTFNLILQATESFPDINQGLNRGDLAIRTLTNLQNPDLSPFYVEQRDGEKVPVGLSFIVDNKRQPVAVAVNTGDGWRVAPLQLAEMYDKNQLTGYSIVGINNNNEILFEILNAYNNDGTPNNNSEIVVYHNGILMSLSLNEQNDASSKLFEMRRDPSGKIIIRQMVEQGKGGKGKLDFFFSDYSSLDVLKPTETTTPTPPQPSPTPEPTATPTPTTTQETLINENELLRLGYLPDFREQRNLVETNFTIPYNGESRQGLGWRIGGIQVVFDQEYVNLEADFSRGGHKTAGEIPIPNLSYPNASEIIIQVANVIHAFNLGVFPWDQPLPADWQQRYQDFLAKNPNASYSISGDVSVPGQPGTFRLEKLGDVNPRLPIRIFILPPRIEKKEAWERVDRIYGGDPRAPFRLPYVNPANGYFGVFVDKNGRLNVYFSDFKVGGKLLSAKDNIGPNIVATTLGALSPSNRGSVSSLSLPNGADGFFTSLFFDEINRIYKNTEIVVWSSP